MVVYSIVSRNISDGNITNFRLVANRKLALDLLRQRYNAFATFDKDATLNEHTLTFTVPSCDLQWKAVPETVAEFI